MENYYHLYEGDLELSIILVEGLHTDIDYKSSWCTPSKITVQRFDTSFIGRGLARALFGFIYDSYKGIHMVTKCNLFHSMKTK